MDRRKRLPCAFLFIGIGVSAWQISGAGGKITHFQNHANNLHYMILSGLNDTS